MLKSIRIDLEDTAESMDHLIASLDRLRMDELVDVGARVGAVCKAAEKVDKYVKGKIKEKLHEKAGTVKGEVFKAVLAYHDVTRLDQKSLKENDPETYSAYCKTSTEGRILFEPK